MAVMTLPSQDIAIQHLRAARGIGVDAHLIRFPFAQRVFQNAVLSALLIPAKNVRVTRGHSPPLISLKTRARSFSVAAISRSCTGLPVSEEVTADGVVVMVGAGSLVMPTHRSNPTTPSTAHSQSESIVVSGVVRRRHEVALAVLADYGRPHPESLPRRTDIVSSASPPRCAPRDHIWLVTFMQYDLGYFDDETCRREPIDNPTGIICYLCAQNGPSVGWRARPAFAPAELRRGTNAYAPIRVSSLCE